MADVDPDFTPRCLKCGSDAVVPDARLIDTDDDGDRQAARVGVQTNPNAWIRKGEVRTKTRAVVCSDCGFVELYAVDPHKIWEAHVDRKANEIGLR